MRGAGRVIFAATLLLLAGTLNIIYGIGALGDAYPWWSLAIFALCVYVIHGILVYGEEESTPRT